MGIGCQYKKSSQHRVVWARANHKCQILPTLPDDIEQTIFGFTLPNMSAPVITFHAHVHAASEATAMELLKTINQFHPGSAMVEQDCVDTSVQQEYERSHGILHRECLPNSRN